jgi:hypothetical protein
MDDVTGKARTWRTVLMKDRTRMDSITESSNKCGVLSKTCLNHSVLDGRNEIDPEAPGRVIGITKTSVREARTNG